MLRGCTNYDNKIHDTLIKAKLAILMNSMKHMATLLSLLWKPFLRRENNGR